MAYFSSNEPEMTQSMPYADGAPEEEPWADEMTDEEDDIYDDGFDQLTDDGEEEIPEEETREMRRARFQTFFDISNLTATIIGAVLVLLLLQLLFSMIDFVQTDFELNFSLLMSRI